MVKDVLTASLLTQRGISLAAFFRKRGGEARFLAFNVTHTPLTRLFAPIQTLPKVNKFGSLVVLAVPKKSLDGFTLHCTIIYIYLINDFLL
jgi:hypothetical protein